MKIFSSKRTESTGLIDHGRREARSLRFNEPSSVDYKSDTVSSDEESDNAIVTPPSLFDSIEVVIKALLENKEQFQSSDVGGGITRAALDQLHRTYKQ